ncbi:hypothetical protein ABZ508_02680 [Streptomyces lavendulocolor]|uniref:Uncharacterized protein n=1 Tax=Streptomyces lavendulocolor TaxID=67316 RepID=A0ABV2VYA8_9ACTN
MPERTHPTQADEALRRVQTHPSHAANFLTTIVHALSDRRIARQPLTTAHWCAATDAAVARVLAGLCQHAAADTVVAAFSGMPPLRDGETCGERAIILQATARALR